MKTIEEQELKDYKIAERIIRGLFGKNLVNMEKLEQYSPVDCAYTACTRTYAMEIKQTTKDVYLTDGFLLKVTKFLKIKQWVKCNGHHPYIIYLCKGKKKYYIFDVDTIQLNEDTMVIKQLKKTEYKVDSVMEETPCIILRCGDAIMYGDYEEC